MLICLETGGRSMISDGRPTEPGSPVCVCVCAPFSMCTFISLSVYVCVRPPYAPGKPCDR